MKKLNQMTEIDIRALKPGPLMDVLIAEELFGIQARDAEGHVYVSRVPRYSENIREAWAILEAMNRVRDPESNFEHYRRWVYVTGHLSEVPLWTMFGPDAAAEICLTALLAIHHARLEIRTRPSGPRATGG